MVKISKKSSTLRQAAYARDSFACRSKLKTEIALNNGFELIVANSVKSKIENTIGYKNEMIKILKESDNVVLSIFAEFRERGFSDFSNKDLVAAVTAISTAWEKFNGAGKGKDDDGLKSPNKLRTIIMQQVENQTIEVPKEKEETKIIEVAPQVYDGF